MGVPEEGAWLGAVQEVLSRSHLWRPEDVAANLAQAVSGPGLRSTPARSAWTPATRSCRSAAGG